MKKWIAMLLALCMLLVFCSCGSQQEAEKSEIPAKTAEETTETEGKAVEAVGEPVNLVACSAFKNTDAEGVMLNYFMDYVTEKSGGTITFTKYMAGTLGTSAEELGMLSNGDIDVMALYAPAYAFELPQFIYVMNAVGTCEEVMDWFSWTCYENEETASILADALSNYNGTLLKCAYAVGQTMFPCTEKITCWDDIKHNLKFGAISDYAEGEGYQSWVLVDAADNYENLRSGLVQALESSVDNIVSAKLYEVSSYFLDTQIYSPFNHLVMNTDKLNSLSEEQQALIYEAAAATAAYSVEYANQCSADAVEIIEEAGGTVIPMTQEELDLYWKYDVEINYASAYEGLGAATGTMDDAAVIINSIMEYWDTDFRVGE